MELIAAALQLTTPVRGTFPSQIWLYRDPSDPFRLVPRIIDVVRLCQRSPIAMAGTRPDLLAALSAPDHTVQYANTTSIVHTHLCTYMGSNLLRCSRVLHNDYSRVLHNQYPRKTGELNLWRYCDWTPLLATTSQYLSSCSRDIHHPARIAKTLETGHYFAFGT